MFLTEITRPSESVLKEQDENNSSNEYVLNKMKDKALELSQILIQPDFNLKEVGTLLNQDWVFKKNSRFKNFQSKH